MAAYTQQGSSTGIGPSIETKKSTQKSTIQQSSARKAKKSKIGKYGLQPIEKAAVDLDPDATEEINRFMRDKIDA